MTTIQLPNQNQVHLFTSNGDSPGKTLMCLTILTYIFNVSFNKYASDTPPIIVFDANKDNHSIFDWLQGFADLDVTLEFIITVDGEKLRFDYYTIGKRVAIIRPHVRELSYKDRHALHVLLSLHTENISFEYFKSADVHTFLIDTSNSLFHFATEIDYPTDFKFRLCPWVIWPPFTMNIGNNSFELTQAKLAVDLLKRKLSLFEGTNVIHVFNPKLLAEMHRRQIELSLRGIRDLAVVTPVWAQLVKGIPVKNFSSFSKKDPLGEFLSIDEFADKINPKVIEDYHEYYRPSDLISMYEMIGQVLNDRLTINSKRYNNVIAIPWYRFELALIKNLPDALELFTRRITEECMNKKHRCYLQGIPEVMLSFYYELEKRYLPQIFEIS